MRCLGRRVVILAAAVVAAVPALASAQGPTPTAPEPAAPDPGRTVRVDMKTGDGTIVLALYPDKAPITVANFLKYVRQKRYDGTTIYRAVRTVRAEDTGFIQGGVQNDPKRVLPPIKLEPTSQTGLHHKDGTITMARSGPNTATSDFVIMVGPASFMDADPTQPGDNLGYAAFGQVVEGMDVVKTILASPSDGHARNPVMKGQILSPPVPILAVRVEKGD